MLRSPILHDLKERLRRGEPLRVLFDSNILLDVFLQREYAVPAARALTFAEPGCRERFRMRIRFRDDFPSWTDARTRQGRAGRERMLAEETMRLFRVLPLTEEVLTAALRYDRLSFEDAQVAAAGELAGVDAILTNDDGFIMDRALRMSTSAYPSECVRPFNLSGATTGTPEGHRDFTHRDFTCCGAFHSVLSGGLSGFFRTIVLRDHADDIAHERRFPCFHESALPVWLQTRMQA